MAFLGLTPTEVSSGGAVRRGRITKAGNGELRRILIEASWCYRMPARVSGRKNAMLDKLPISVREIAWKAQTRLCARYRRMAARGKPANVVVCAIAREVLGFAWAIAREVREVRPAAA
jgi:transposase